MTSIWVRENSNSFTAYRVYADKKEKLCNISKQLPDEDVHAARSMLETSFEKSKFEAWLKNQKQLIREQQLLKIISDGPDKLMIDIADALALLVKADPNCQKPGNKKLADEVWKAWGDIWKQVGSKSGWNIKQKEALKQH